jgi:glycine/D-amino acid oxidase-like deaminating enzyme
VTTHVDVIVVGQGLAGTALAWHHRWRGRRVLVLDREDTPTPSRVAAGLLTPVTGRRLVPAPGWHHLRSAAAEFYRRVEVDTGRRFFYEDGAVRLFTGRAERELFDRRTDPGFRALVRTPSETDDAAVAAPLGGFEMPSAAQVDVPAYLTASRARFAADGGYRFAAVDPARDVELNPGGVVLPKLGVTAGVLFFCDGPAAVGNPWLADLRWNPAAGEILTVRVPGLVERRVVHCGVWLAPAGDGLFRAGSTYRWDDLHPEPTDAGREEIVAKLSAFLRLPFEVVGHEAAVRPVLADGRPIAGWHPLHPRIGFVNGLGSKGALLAPSLAARLVG